MRTSTWLVAVTLGATALRPAAAQKAGEENFIANLFSAIFAPRWSVYAHGGSSSFGNFLLQSATGGERALRGERSWSAGAGAGVDLLPRVGFRMTYAYATTNLEFRDDNGDGSTTLDQGDLAKLTSHIAAIEVIRYMLPSRVLITPYGTVGFAGGWWLLDPRSAVIDPSGGRQQFRFGGSASFGLQFRLSHAVFARMEASSTSLRNPFTGDRSYRALGGFTIDEPSRVSKTEYRLAVVYFFGEPLIDKD